MNVLFLTLLDFTSIEEHGIYTDLMREFIKNGHKVYIISPTEKRKNEPTRILDHGYATILKLQIGNTQKTNLIEKGISTLTLESKFKSGIRKYFDSIKFDLVIYSTPPITLQKAVEFVKHRDGAITYLLLKDIFPQNAVDLGILRTTGLWSIIYKYFRKKEERLYQNSDYIGCMSGANVKYLLKHNPTIPAEIVEVCPNSIEPQTMQISEKEKREVRIKYNIPLDKSVFIYGGNLGKPQGIDFIIDCLRANENSIKSFILIVGSGTEFHRLEKYFNNERPQNAKLINHLPKVDFEILVNSCDVGLIFLDRRFTIPNFPSRILSYMQASMPVLAVTDKNTDIGYVCDEGGFGWKSDSNDVNSFVNIIDEILNKDLKFFGRNGWEYLCNNYSVERGYKIIMNHFGEENE